MTLHTAGKPARQFDETGLVYVRPITPDELEQILPANALESLGTTEDLFAVHSADGARLAIVEGRDAAFAAARAHQLKPASLH